MDAFLQLSYTLSSLKEDVGSYVSGRSGSELDERVGVGAPVLLLPH